MPGSSVTRGMVVDVVVVLNGVVRSSLGVYRRIRGGRNSKYNANNNNTKHDMETR